MTIEHEKKVVLGLSVNDSGPALRSCTVTVPAACIEQLYQDAIQVLQKSAIVQGFARGDVPAAYIAQHYAVRLKNHVQDFCLNYFVLPFLYRSIRTHKFLVVGLPRFTSAEIARGKDASFSFELSTIPAIPLREWKYLPFKAPKRKRYKDLDRQAELFIKTEQELEEKNRESMVSAGDWVHLHVAPLTQEGVPLFGDHTESFWIKIGFDEIDYELHEPLLNKTIGTTLTTTNEHILKYFCNRSHIPMNFQLTIADIVHDSFFCFEQFKKCFRLKNKRDIQQKLIEVFSYQQDLSQRRSMAERSVALLLAKNKFEIPPQLFADQQDLVMIAVRYNPDYHVYRNQKDFQKRIEQLARKQAAEILILDQVAYQENIDVSYADIRSYFNLMKRPRTKEFIYFNPPITKIDGQESLIYQEEIAYLSCREKTLNYIIHHLTRT